MKKRIALLLVAAMTVVSLAACGNNAQEAPAAPAETEAPAATGNAAKPLVWFNRQPGNADTGALDMDALSFNGDTYYVGFDAVQGAKLQGEMILEYLKNADESIDRNGDGIIGYVLAIGDVGHNDSIARTRGARLALGTGKGGSNIEDIDSTPVGTNKDGSSGIVQDGKVTINGKEYIIRELASQEMKNEAGATWDAATAGTAIDAWTGDFGDQIDLVVSNNDGMGMSIFNKWSESAGVPTFGYDANSDAVDAVANRGFGGTISQHADVQAYLTLRLLRNALDGGDMAAGISTPDDAGNVLSDSDYYYDEATRSYYALNLAITSENASQFLDATAPYGPVSNQLDAGTHAAKKVWLDIYNSTDNFLNDSYKPLLENYDDILNLEVEYVAGDGQSESSVTDKFVNLEQYDGFAINPCKTDNAAAYTSILMQ